MSAQKLVPRHPSYWTLPRIAKALFFSKHHRIGCDFLVLQNERFDDWKPTLLQLRKLFTDYKRCIVDYHKTGNPEKDQFIPKGIFKWFLIYYKYISPSKYLGCH
jgi:hypothetical protein